MRSTTISESGRGIRRRLVALAMGLALLLVLAAIASIFDRSTVVDGPAGSSFVTTAMGSAALFETLEELDRNPERLTRPLAMEQLSGVDTYLALDPGFSQYGEVEVASLRRFVEEGGTVVVAGLPPGSLASGLLEEAPDWNAGVITEARLPEGGTVAAGRFGSFSSAGSAQPLLVAEEGILAVEERVGAGRVVLVADVAVFSNERLDEGENAEFGVELAGSSPLFDELRHGFGEGGEGGLFLALPGRWGEVLWLLAAAGTVGLFVYGRRFGPPEPTSRALVPERRLFLESVSRTLIRSGDPVRATRPVRELARRVLSERAALAADASEEELAGAARAAGLADEEIAAVLEPGGEPDSVLAADAALAHLLAGPGARPERREEHR